jgi:RNA recognition motif-containing protein
MDLPMTTIHVGNLPFSATEAEVRSLFEQFGRVDTVKIVNDRDTGQPRGFAYVDMPGADAHDAIQHTNGFEMNGRALRVSEARERAAQPPRRGSGDRW